MIKYSFIYHTLFTIAATDNFVYDFFILSLPGNVVRVRT